MTHFFGIERISDWRDNKALPTVFQFKVLLNERLILTEGFWGGWKEASNIANSNPIGVEYCTSSEGLVKSAALGVLCEPSGFFYL